MTRLRAALLPGLACLIVGAAGWASRAELDERLIAGLRQRFALVPSWQPLLAFAALAAVGLVALAMLVSRVRPALRPRLATLVLPAFGLVLLLVPFLPLLPDWWPGLQALAGPGAWLVWALVATQMLWSLWPYVPAVGTWCGRRPLTVQTLAIWIATAAVSTVAARQLTHTSLFPSGDEPHYLVIAQSLWRDGDLQIENNHQRRDYAEYFARDLDPHYLTRGADREIYSIHPVGMPVLITPLYALGGYDLVLAAFIAMSATAAAVIWRWAVQLTQAPGAVTLAWAAIVGSAPFLINTFTIYPEIPAALAVAVGLVLTLRVTAGGVAWQDVVIGLAAGALPWLSTKYAPMSAALVAVALARRAWPLHSGERGWQVASGLRVVLPYGLCLLAWFAFFYAYWGTPNPSAPYGAMRQTSLFNTVFGVPGLLFDQEYGLLIFAPAYLLAGTGLWTMLRRPGPLRRLGLELLVVFGALLMTVGAFRIWWGGSAAPGRPIASGLLVLLLPMAVQLGTATAGSTRRAAHHLLIWTGVALAVVIVFAQGGLLVSNDRDGTSSLLEWFSPRWPLWTLAPTFIAHEAPRALVDVAAWLVVLATGSWALGRVHVATRSAAALAAMAIVVAVVVAGAVAMRTLPPADPPLPGIDLRTRSRLPALDTFDHVTRPVMLRYRPVTLAPAVDVVSNLALEVTAGARSAPQPLRVLHNGRFSLPAGRYRVVVDWVDRNPLPAREGATVALQVGRVGLPLATWTVTPSPGGSFTAEFSLPVDAGFVGLRGSAEVERSIAAIRFEPISVVDVGDRVTTAQVLGATAYGDAVVLFHEDYVYPEPTGFWTTGKRATHVTIACPGGCRDGIALKVHSGARANQLTLSTLGWSRTLDLQGAQAADVQVPPPSSGEVIQLTLTTSTGFSPVDVDPTARDRRYLGAWIEVHHRREMP